MALPLIAGIVAGVGALASLASTLTKKPPELKYRYQSGTPDPMLSYLPDYRVEPMRKAYKYVEPKNIASKILGVAGTVLGATGTVMGGFTKKVPTGELAATRGAGLIGALGTGIGGAETVRTLGAGVGTRTFEGSPIKPPSMLAAQSISEVGTVTPEKIKGMGEFMTSQFKVPQRITPKASFPNIPELPGWNTDIFKRIPALTTLWGSEKVPDWMNFQEKIYKQYPKQYL